MSELTIQELYARCAQLAAQRDGLITWLRTYVSALPDRIHAGTVTARGIAQELEARLEEGGEAG